MSKTAGRSGEGRAVAAVSRALQKVVFAVPSSAETTASDPRARSQKLAVNAAWKAGSSSAAMSIPPGPLGWLMLLPDLVAIWKIQSKMVADIAAAYGKSGTLNATSLVYCLFKHGSAALFRDVVVRVGERVLVKHASTRFLQELLSKISVKVSQKTVGKAIARYLPLLGALGVGAYAYYDTSKVAATAIELFSLEVDVEEPGSTEG